MRIEEVRQPLPVDEFAPFIKAENELKHARMYAAWDGMNEAWARPMRDRVAIRSASIKANRLVGRTTGDANRPAGPS